jgi:hypothetical protein
LAGRLSRALCRQRAAQEIGNQELLRGPLDRAGSRLNRQVFVFPIGREALQDRAMGAMIAPAGINERGERMFHILQVRDLFL